MADHTITYFPVGNGDTSLIKLRDGTTLVVDLNRTEASSDDGETSIYDVHEHLLMEARRDSGGIPHHDGFLLSHPDQDHIRGFATVFYVGDPAKYAKTDKDAGRMVIDELWFAPRVFSPHEEGEMSDDAKAFKREAQRRMKLYLSGATTRTDQGNRIRIIGYSDNPDLEVTRPQPSYHCLR